MTRVIIGRGRPGAKLLWPAFPAAPRLHFAFPFRGGLAHAWVVGVIDAHVHLYPAEVAADPAGWSAHMGEPRWAALVTPHPERRVRQGWADRERLLRDMDAAGVERAVLLGWYWESQRTCVWHNRYHAACVRAHPDRLSWFATVQAAAGRPALEEMDRAAAEGAIGLGEMCPWTFGVPPLDPAWRAVFARAAELRWPVNLHVTDPASRPFAGRVETPLADILALAQALPELSLILAHWGGGLALREWSPREQAALGGAVFDTAATPLLYDRTVYRRAVARVGAERILFGSDYPLLVHRREQTEPGFARVIAEVRASGLGEGDAAAILGGNARRRFGAHARE